MTDREQMTPEELAATLLDFAVADSVHTAEARHRLTEAAAHLRRLAALEWENTRLRGVLSYIRRTDDGNASLVAREALASAPDASASDLPPGLTHHLRLYQADKGQAVCTDYPGCVLIVGHPSPHISPATDEMEPNAT